MWTHFYDMHSGGSTKEAPYQHIYIEADKAEAVRVFVGKFGHNPNRVTCMCCGEDYSISSGDDLAALTEFHRSWPKKDDPIPLDRYLQSGSVLVIRDKDIRPEWRTTEVKKQGYVWQD